MDSTERGDERYGVRFQIPYDWLRLVTDNVPALVAYLAPGPVYRFANRRYAKWFDQTVASIVGRSPRA